MRTIIGRTSGRLAPIAALALPLLLSGCFVISTHRSLPVPKAPAVVQTATPENLWRGWTSAGTIFRA